MEGVDPGMRGRSTSDPPSAHPDARTEADQTHEAVRAQQQAQQSRETINTQEAGTPEDRGADASEAGRSPLCAGEQPPAPDAPSATVAGTELEADWSASGSDEHGLAGVTVPSGGAGLGATLAPPQHGSVKEEQAPLSTGSAAAAAMTSTSAGTAPPWAFRSGALSLGSTLSGEGLDLVAGPGHVQEEPPPCLQLSDVPSGGRPADVPPHAGAGPFQLMCRAGGAGSSSSCTPGSSQNQSES